MKYLIASFMVLVFSQCATSSPEQRMSRSLYGNTKLSALNADSVTMRKFLSLGIAKKIPARHVSMTLYAVGVPGECTKDKSTFCAHHYLLATAAKTTPYPATNIYDLGVVGEITQLRVLNAKDKNKVELSLHVSNYPKRALRRNKTLFSKVEEARLILEGDLLEISQD